MFDSFIEHAAQPNKMDVIFYIDDDDSAGEMGGNKLKRKYGNQIKLLIGPRITLSKTHTECFKLSDSELACYTGDDVCAETHGFDDVVRTHFNKYPDKILLAAPRDGYNPNTATSGYLHRNWFNVTGHITPPFFEADQADDYLTRIAKTIGRFEWMDIMMRHYHPAAVPGVIVDETMQEKIDRGNRAGNGLMMMRQEVQDKMRWDIINLKKFIEDYK